MRILMAEDNATNLKVGLLMLERLGYRADVAGNGLEAIEALHRLHYDLVLMDVQMPEMDGLAATRRIRQEFPPDKQPRIVAMTANAMAEDREACLQAGMNDYISKPIQLTHLAEVLERNGKRIVASGVLSAQVPRGSEGLRPNSAGEEEKPVLAPGALKQLRATLGKKADSMLPGLLESYHQDAQQLIAEMRLSLGKSDPAVASRVALRRAAHTLKSNSATFGAMALAEAARVLEYKARDGDLSDGAALLEKIESEYQRARQALDTYAGAEPDKEDDIHD